MSGLIKVEIEPNEVITAIKQMSEEDRESFIEDLLAAISPEYIDSIKESRADYNAGRIKTHDEVFGT